MLRRNSPNDLIRVSKLLGHSDVAITAKVYVHELASLGDDSAEKLESILRGISNKSATSAANGPSQSPEGAANVDANSLNAGENEVVERKGIEPSTFALRTRRSPS